MFEKGSCNLPSEVSNASNLHVLLNIDEDRRNKKNMKVSISILSVFSTQADTFCVDKHKLLYHERCELFMSGWADLASVFI